MFLLFASPKPSQVSLNNSDLNDEEIAKTSQNPSTTDPSKLSIDKYLDNVNPHLIEFLNIAMQSAKLRQWSESL